MPMSQHNIRSDDDLWSQTSTIAASEGNNMSMLIRQWMQDYTGADLELDERITYLRARGCTLKVIANVTGMSVSGVSRVLSRS